MAENNLPSAPPQVTAGAVLVSKVGVPLMFIALGYLLGRFGGKK